MMEATCSSKRQLTFNRLHGVASQKIELFITTAVRTSDHVELFITTAVRTSDPIELSITTALRISDPTYMILMGCESPGDGWQNLASNHYFLRPF
jgi:hypothetical protein